MPAVTPNIAWVLRRTYPLSKKDIRLAAGVGHHDQALAQQWLEKCNVQITEEIYRVRLWSLWEVLGVFEGCSDHFMINWLRGPQTWSNGSTVTARRAIGQDLGDEVLAQARIAVAAYKKRHAKPRKAAKEPRRSKR